MLLLSVVVAALAQAAEPNAASPAAPDETQREVTSVLAAAKPLEVKVAHGYTRDIARERVGYLLAYWSRRFGVKSHWSGDCVYLVGTVWGVDLKARFDVGDHSVVALSNDPGLLLRSRATDYVERKLRKYMHPTYDEPAP